MNCSQANSTVCTIRCENHAKGCAGRIFVAPVGRVFEGKLVLVRREVSVVLRPRLSKLKNGAHVGTGFADVKATQLSASP